MFKAGDPNNKNRKNRKEAQDEFDRTLGIQQSTTVQGVLGYLTNFKSTVFTDRTVNLEHAGMLCYFVGEDGSTYRATLKYRPYFYLAYREGYEKEVRMYIDSKIKKYESAQEVSKVDLEEMNHLSGKPKFYMKVWFRTVSDLMNARGPIKQMLDGRKSKEGQSTGTDANFLSLYDNNMREVLDNGEYITGIRQFDIPYHSRICIDCGIRAGKWFQMDIKNGVIEKIAVREDILSRPELKILAFDIETSKDPLKFPDAEKDVVMMISLMFDGMAYLIVNLGFCGQAVSSFSYTPKAEFACEVIVFNEESEKATLEKFFKLIQVYKPSVITSFNGDKFDIPFIVTRCQKLGINFEAESGLYNETEGEYYGRYISHLDCYYWVDRDAYLPQGSHGLKAVTKAKLHYDPIEVNPEDMVGLAIESTQKLAQYSVSDAVATFFLYMKHIHDFIFALCTIIPMYPDEVLRKGSGTLCENLLMAEAFNRNIIFPNKKAEEFMKIVDGHRIDSETYTGGKVQCLRTGVYRADFLTDFQLDPNAFQFLIDNLAEVISFTIQHQSKNQTVATCTNYEKVKENLATKLQAMRDVKTPHKYMCKPLIYHLDVAAMYPNIILTNRLQPVAIVNERICGNCIYVSEEGANCKRQLEWEWKGEVFPLAESQFATIQNRLDLEIRTKKDEKFCPTPADYQKELKKRVKLYCQKSYKKVHISRQEIRKDTVCMRENSFYVDTVKAFRDRRYDFKAAVKSSKSKYEQFVRENNHSAAKQAKELMALYESLQLAHKIILNSFYGYVMRKGARWYSMQTAAMVTYVGSNIISDCKNFIEARIGKPLELDTDGIWLLLPQGFPQNETLQFENGDKCHLSYPCAILNLFIYEKYLNNQYQTVDPQTNRYETHTQMSIQFEIDGPYKAMFIPAAKEKQKTKELDTTLHSTQLLKKRYVVYNFKNQISEFKGFEMKRRGELQIVKIFQSEIFDQYLKGNDLKQCYEACAKVAKDKVNLLLRKGENLTHHDLISYLEESKVLSRDLDDYAEQKGVAVTAAKRLSQFLGSNCIRGKGICCYFIISEKPLGSPVTERAIPTSIFQADEAVQRQFLSRWLGQKWPDNEPIELRMILDWNYYFERLSSTIQKMVCIPAVLQDLDNPLPEVPLPDWLKKKTFDERTHKQLRINSFKLVPVIKKTVPEEKKTTAADKAARIIPKPAAKTAPKVNPYSLNHQFNSWLKAQIQSWKENTSDNRSQAFSHDWNILQLVPSRTPGAFILWYFSGNRVQSTELILDRRYYVLSKETHKRLMKKAYRQEGVAEQIVIEETKFQKEKQYYCSFLGIKTYETKLPLDTNFFINTGNMCRVRDRLKSYRQEQLQPVFGELYLSNYQRNLPTATILSVAYLDNIVWAVHFSTEADSQYRFVFTRHSFTGLEKAREKDIYYKIARNILGNNGIGIQIEGFGNLSDTVAYVNEFLMEQRLRLRQAFLVVVRSDLSPKQLQELGLKELYIELPVLALPKVDIEDTSSLNSLSWRDRLLRMALEELSSTPELLQNIVRQARYSHIPICNTPVSSCRIDTITNIMYSRVLRAGDNLLWWDQFNSSADSFYESPIYTGRINNAGLYSSYCVEFDIANLPLNAILASEELLGQSNMTNNNPSKKHQRSEMLDEMSSVYTVFEYLRKMVRAFIEDIDNKSQQADFLVQNLYKWLITRTNSLYDPLLHRLVKQITKSLFYTFMLKVKAMGFKIVFANFERLIVSTENNTHQEAVNRTKFMLSKCLEDEKKKYRYIILTPVRVWKLILWRDTHNFAGFTENEPGEMQYESNWELTKNLSPQIAKVLPGPIFVYLQKISKIKDDIIKDLQKDHRELFMTLASRYAENVCNYIEGEFTERIVEGIYSLLNSWAEYMNHGSNLLEKETKDEQAQSASEESEQDEQEENDSFVVEDDVFDVEGDMQQHQRKKKGQRKKAKQDQKEPEADVWGEKHQLQFFIENLFYLLASDNQAIQEKMEKLRSKALKAIDFEPFIRYEVVKPIYPLFEIPCELCFRINESPGRCPCNNQLRNISELVQYSVWQMINQIGTDLWCNICRSNRVDYLKHCPCGGKWTLGQNPLEWIKYVDRSGKDWEFVDTVLEFMGLTQEHPGL